MSGYQSLKFVQAKIETLDRGSFLGCSNLEFIDLSRVKIIPNEAFCNCFKLRNQRLNAFKIGEKAFQNCVSMNFIEALKLQKCEIDSFLNSSCQLKTEFKGDLVDVERVQEIDNKEFQYLKDFNFKAHDAKNYILTKIKFDKNKLRQLKTLQAIFATRNILNAQKK